MNIPSAGDIIAGKYRVERILGQGGMGVVVAAMHTQLEQRVAIKLLLADATPELGARFLREARAAVRLRSEHVARVLDVGESANGAPYLVMEYLDGSDLAEVLARRGALPVEEAVEMLLHTCEAIAEAHSIGIIHRDLKPANLFLTQTSDRTNTIKVLDFGISKSLEGSPDGDGLNLTHTATILGSPLYMSPEQLRSAREVTAESDIWSLGAILFQLLTGEVPFKAPTFSGLVLAISLEPPPRPSTARGELPPELEAAILRCLEKKPEARFPNVAELAQAIVAYGPPEGRASAERIARTLMAAGIPVSRTLASAQSRSTSRPSISVLPPAPRNSSAPIEVPNLEHLGLAQTVAATGAEALPHSPVVGRRLAPAKVAGALGLAALLGVGAFWLLRAPAPVSSAAPSAAAAVIPPPSAAAMAGASLPAEARPAAVTPEVPTAAASATASVAGTPPHKPARQAPTPTRPHPPAPVSAPAVAPTATLRNPLDFKPKY